MFVFQIKSSLLPISTSTLKCTLYLYKLTWELTVSTHASKHKNQVGACSTNGVRTRARVAAAADAVNCDGDVSADRTGASKGERDDRDDRNDEREGGHDWRRVSRATTSSAGAKTVTLAPPARVQSVSRSS